MLTSVLLLLKLHFKQILLLSSKHAVQPSSYFRAVSHFLQTYIYAFLHWPDLHLVYLLGQPGWCLVYLSPSSDKIETIQRRGEPCGIERYSSVRTYAGSRMSSSSSSTPLSQKRLDNGPMNKETCSPSLYRYCDISSGMTPGNSIPTAQIRW